MKKISLIICIILGLFISSSMFLKKRALDKYYLERFTTVKKRMLSGSNIDSKQSLDSEHDQIELLMHLDGYDAIDVMKIRVKAFKQACIESYQD